MTLAIDDLVMDKKPSWLTQGVHKIIAISVVEGISYYWVQSTCVNGIEEGESVPLCFLEEELVKAYEY